MSHAEVITTISNYLADLGASRRGAVADGPARSRSTIARVRRERRLDRPLQPPGSPELGTASLTILSGTGAITGAVSFVPPFGVAPIVTLQSQDPV